MFGILTGALIRPQLIPLLHNNRQRHLSSVLDNLFFATILVKQQQATTNPLAFIRPRGRKRNGRP
jgi:hypothetical protein